MITLLIILITLIAIPVIILIFYLFPYLKIHDGELSVLRHALFAISVAKLVFLFSEIYILTVAVFRIKASIYETWLLIFASALFCAANWYAFFKIRKI